LHVQKAERGSVRGVFVFALLAMFAVLSLLVVIIGARAYKGINASADAAYASRTGMSYLVGKVRGADETGMISVVQQDGAAVLVLGGLYGGERYNTYIYCDGKSVLEYFANANQAFSAGYGEEILPAQTLSFRLEGNLLSIHLVDTNGEEHDFSLCLSAGGEASA
jgi:hypothetical protein